MKSLRKGLFLAAVMVVGSTLYAQPAQPPVEPVPAPAPSAGVSLKLSASEMASNAVQLEGEVRVHLQHVQHLQNQARKEKDVIKLSCINDKMLKLKADANMFDNAKVELLASLDNEDTRGGAYTKVTTAASEVQKTREEADRCVGEPELTSDESANSWTGPDVIDDPTTGNPFPTGPGGTVLEPPTYASPYD